MIDPNKRILVIGANGYIGSHLYEYFKKINSSTLGTSRRATDKLNYFDLLEPSFSFLEKLTTPISHAIICTGISSIAKCEQSPKETFKQNVLGILNLVLHLTEKKIKPILFSSDVVFDGSRKTYYDSSTPAPINEYGKQKAYLEKLIPEICDEYLILRLSKVYSAHKKDQTFINTIIQNLLKSETIQVCSDLIFNPIIIDDVIKAIYLLIYNNSKGIYNLSNNKSTSWYDIANIVVKELKLDEASIQEVSIDQLCKGVKRAKTLNVQPRKLLKEFSNFKISDLNLNIKNLVNLYSS